jgi:beta-mannosidase
MQKELIANWKFKQADKEGWNKAIVPGNVHIDLEKNGVIENPFYGTNENDIQWIEKKDWIYEGTFNVEDDLLEFSNVELEFEGLDTYSDVFLNGEKIITSKNMFIAYTAEVKKLLKKGENTIKVVFHSPIKMAMPLFEKSNFTYPADNDRSKEHLSVFTRKAPYHYGWDWGPRFVTSGIWRPINIKAWNSLKIEDIQVIQKSLSNDKSDLSFVYEIQSEVNENVQIEISAKEFSAVTKDVEVKKGLNTISVDFTIENPKKWWPNGMGEAYLYNIISTVKNGDNTIDQKKNRVGLRTIEVINELDSIGESFFIKVNGIPTFLKGANYIPNDSFLGRVTDSVYNRNFKDAVSSNMNILRVWGGGVYEDDRFYELADENGILIWQDFMFACTMYPSDDDFLKNVEDEAIYNIKRLRNHASLALWCGNNEIQVGWDNWGWQDSYKYTEEDQKELLEGYDKLFNKLLPKKVKELDPNKFYYPSSPISNWANKSDFSIGDNQYWGVWWGKKTFESFNEYVPRFMSEYGFQSFPNMETISEFADKNSWDIDSDIMKSHQKSSIGNVTIKEYMERDYRMPSNFEDFVYINQVMQAEGMRIAFEAHRRNKPFNMGTIYWQFNDVWPVVSWSGIDYFGRWKAMQYFVKKAFEPVISSAVVSDGILQVNVISDLIHKQEVISKIKIVTLSGETVWSRENTLSLKGNDNFTIVKEDLEHVLGKYKIEDVVLVMNTIYNEKNIENTFLLAKPKKLNLQKPDINLSSTKVKGGFIITIKSNTFVKNIQLSTNVKGRFENNYFDLQANKKYEVLFETSVNKFDVKNVLEIKSIRSTY